jgi:hypothetical protein
MRMQFGLTKPKNNPANMTYEEAATVPVIANTALHFIRDMGNVQAGQRVLINYRRCAYCIDCLACMEVAQAGKRRSHTIDTAKGRKRCQKT